MSKQLVFLVAGLFLIAGGCTAERQLASPSDDPVEATPVTPTPISDPGDTQDDTRRLNVAAAEGFAQGLDVALNRYGAGTATDVSLVTCSDSVTGSLGQGWRDEATVTGPLAFTHAPHYADPDRDDVAENEEGRFRALKNLAVVEPGAVVYVVVPDDSADRLGLLYPGFGVVDAQGYAALEDAQRAVVFIACANRSTQFAGSLLPIETGCASLDVWVPGASEPESLPLSINAGEC